MQRTKYGRTLHAMAVFAFVSGMALSAVSAEAVASGGAARHRLHSVEEVEANNNWQAERLVRAETRALNFFSFLVEADLPVLLIALFIFMVTVGLAMSMPELIAEILKRFGLRERIARLVWVVLFVGIFGVGALTALSVFEVDIAYLLQAIGFFGIWLSYGFGPYISNVVGGLMLPFFVPIEVGKHVKIVANERVEGVVEFVTLRHTAVIVTNSDDGSRMRAWIPNHDFELYTTWEKLPGALVGASTTTPTQSHYDFRLKEN